jgi:hypothetical protein
MGFQLPSKPSNLLGLSNLKNKKPIDLKNNDWLEKIVDYYFDENPARRQLFIRNSQKRTNQEKKKIWEAVLARKNKKHPKKSKKVKSPELVQISNLVSAEFVLEFVLEEPIDSESDFNEQQRIVWSDEEWERLTLLVWHARKNDPSENLVGLVNKVMAEFPNDRKQTIHSLNEVEPLIEQLKAHDQKILNVFQDLEDANIHIELLEEERKNVPSRDQVLNSLTNEEVTYNFRQRVLDQCSPEEIVKQFTVDVLFSNIQFSEIVSYVMKESIEMVSASQNQILDAVKELTSTIKQMQFQQNIQAKPSAPLLPSMPMLRPISRLPKVTIVGLKSDQYQEIERRLSSRANFNFVDKNRHANIVPTGHDIVVLATAFISHADQACAKKSIEGTSTKLIYHHGGVNKLIRELDTQLSKMTVTM